MDINKIAEEAMKQFPNTLVRLEDSPSKVQLCIHCKSPKIYKNDGDGKPICKECAFGVVKSTPINHAALGITKIGNNEPCPCGKTDKEGKRIKFKKCCKNKEEEKEIYNNQINQN